MSASEQKKIIVLGIFFGVLLTFFILFFFQSFKPTKVEDRQRTTEKEDWVDPRFFAEKEIELPQDLAMQIKESTPDEKVVKEREPFLYLFRAVQRASMEAMSQRGFAEVTPSQLKKEPASFRAKRVMLKGTLVQTLKESSFMIPGSKERESYVEGRMVTEGEHVIFSLFDMPEEDLDEGDLVKIQGIFFKIYLIIDIDSQGKQVTIDAPYIIGKSLRRTYRYVPATVLDPKIIDGTKDDTFQEVLRKYPKDGSGKAERVFETEEFFHILNYTRNLAPEDVKKLNPLPVTSRDLRNNPDQYRGKMVRFKCMIQAMWKVPLSDNPSGASHFYYSLVSTGERVMVTVMFADRDKPKGVEILDYVEITGVFFKKYAFESEEQTIIINPLVIGKDIRRIIVKEPFVFRGVMLGISVVLIVAVFFFLAILFSDKKKNYQFRKLYLEKRKRHIAGEDLNRVGRELAQRVRSGRKKGQS